MYKKSCLQKVLVFFILLLVAGAANSALVAPLGLNAGDRFHLIFVTSGTTDAFSADISTYNTFVQMTADNAGIGSSIGLTQWHVLGSTPTVNASDNLAAIFNNQSNVPLFNMRGRIVSNSLLDLWASGSINTILYEENGAPNYGDVWTGTQPNGIAAPNTALGASSLLSQFAFPYNASQNISAAPLAFANQFIQKHLYGVSQELVVLNNGSVAPSPVPVPSAFLLFASGIITLFGAKRKCRKIF